MDYIDDSCPSCKGAKRYAFAEWSKETIPFAHPTEDEIDFKTPECWEIIDPCDECHGTGIIAIPIIEEETPTSSAIMDFLGHWDLIDGKPQ
jgi:hypothetical protein